VRFSLQTKALHAWVKRFEFATGTVSQPSMGALVNMLAGSELDTGIKAAGLKELSSYWENTRQLYCQFESDLRSPASDVYVTEMPGGQYTNLRVQAESNKLNWDAVKRAYPEANRVLGDIVKVRLVFILRWVQSRNQVQELFFCSPLRFSCHILPIVLFILLAGLSQLVVTEGLLLALLHESRTVCCCPSCSASPWD
jgi:Conserved carboxylase domain